MIKPSPLLALALRCCKTANAVEEIDTYEVADLEIRGRFENDGRFGYEAHLGIWSSDDVLPTPDGALLALEQVLLRAAANMALEATS